ncbi:MAG: FtsW/RodA/SpoVE family cell cycle protein, partial [Acidobacteriota bacterium]|nr:FtsW/RodA/SpoVE family cell cycle protein [Acidobacteriota bacterium]
PGDTVMAVTRSTPENRAGLRQRANAPARATRMPELIWLVAAALIVCGSWWLVYSAKARRAAMPAPGVVLSQLDRAEQLYPVLAVFQSAGDREFAARRIIDTLADREGVLPNTGALARIRVPRADLINNKKTDELRQRAESASGDSITLFTAAEFAQIKPQIAVRTVGAFRSQFLIWTGAILAAFLLTHLIWTVRGFTGPWAFLPLLLILTGIGFGLMVALRDPVRDTLIFVPFAEGVAGGCLVMLAASFVEWEAVTAGYSFVPLLGAVALSVALIFFGSGPGGSDARVNLGPFQPVEAIKILLVFFIAGYFAKRWPLLRELREKRFVIPGVELPPLEYAAPVLVGVAVALLFFFLQKDLGPALVFASVFLTLYAIARNRVALASSGLAALLGGFLVGYFMGTPKTVHDRVAMWLSPWSNTAHGGDQVVHSLWAMASGGPLGTGPGLGESDVIPAGYTDLIVSVLGEEWGFLGIAAVYGIFALLIWMGLRIARRARTDYAFFLALGLSLLVSAELLLISGGILDLFPLSGVATPFLSYGRTAMLANFLIAGILLALGRDHGPVARTAPFHSGLRCVEVVLCGLVLSVVGKAAYVQLAHADAIAGEGTLVLQADGGRRFIYNPRLISAARTLQRGGIYDRTGLPMATSNWDELEKHRGQYKELGIDIDKACNRADPRFYPFGALTFHLLGDVRTRANWSAQNSSLVERDDAVRLQGYDDRAHIVEVKDAQGKPFYSVRYDYRELLPLLRHRWEPEDKAVKRVRDRDRNVHLSIHAGLQVRVGQILKARLAEQHLDKGSVVVMDPATGDLLASVNLPAPDLLQEKLALGDAAGSLLDRARYGLYPPGSTFKIVTAIAALRLDPALARQQYQCVRLPDGRTGNFVGNSKRPIRDDLEDRVPHGTLDMNQAIVVSCNAYFAQLGTYKVGAQQLLDTAKVIGISVANPATVKNLRPQMPQISYGQGQVVVSPFQMARVASAVAAGGSLPFGRWVLDESNTRTSAAQQLLPANLADLLAKDMRGVVLNGTGRSLAGIQPAIAGKTGTAELATAPSHAWFIGFAPYTPGRRIAFSVLAENGHYGGTAAAPIAGDVTLAAKQLGLIQ